MRSRHRGIKTNGIVGTFLLSTSITFIIILKRISPIFLFYRYLYFFIVAAFFLSQKKEGRSEKEKNQTLR